MINRITILTAGAVTALALAAAPAVASASGPAISSHCQVSGQYNDLQLKSPVFNMGVLGGAPVAGAQVIAATPAAGEGFYLQTQPNGSGCYIEYAPLGVRSGFCVSQPNPAVRTAIRLYKCGADNRDQTWRAANLDNTGAYRLAVNLRSGLAIADPGSLGNGTPLVSRRPGFGSASNELWTITTVS